MHCTAPQSQACLTLLWMLMKLWVQVLQVLMHPNGNNRAAEPLHAPEDFSSQPPQCQLHTVHHYHLVWPVWLDDFPLHQPSHHQQLILARLVPCPLILCLQHSPQQQSHDQPLKLCARQQPTQLPEPIVRP